MKRFLMVMLAILLIIPASLIPKQESYAFGFGMDPITTSVKLANWAWNIKSAKDKKIKDKATGKDEKTKTPKVSGTVSETTSSGSSMNGTDLSDETMIPTVYFSAFQEAVSKFISIITVIGAFYLGISILRSIGMCLISIAKLALVPNFPKARYFLFKNLGVSVVCIVLLGSVGLLTQLVAGIVF